MKIHRLAKYFPILEGEEFDLLVEDIRKNGQLEPIITVDGEILDGVNRSRACKRLGIEPIVEEYAGDDPLGYVISLNIRRRHLDTSQRAMLATEMLPEFEKEAKERKSESAKKQWSRSEDHLHPASTGAKAWDEKHSARDDAAKLFGVSGPTVQRAKRISKEAPEKVADIIKGKTTVSAVDEELRRKEAERRGTAREAKTDKKALAEHPTGAKEYFDAIKTYRDALTLAIRLGKQGIFSPEAAAFIKTKHGIIRSLMAELEASV